MADVVVIGGGGHAKVLIAVLHKLGWSIVGYTDRDDRGAILGAARLGWDDALVGVLAGHPGCAALVGVGKIDASPLRQRLQRDAEALGFEAPVVVSPHAVVNEAVRLGAGTMVFDGVAVNSGATTGDACILNTNATIEHDCIARRRRACGAGRDRERRRADRRSLHDRRRRSGDPRRLHLRWVCCRRWRRRGRGHLRARRVRRQPRQKAAVSGTSDRLAVIPARGGSKRIPGKNLVPLLGRPLLAYTVEAALQSGLFSRVVVSTDSEEIAGAARSAGAEIPFLREAEPVRRHRAGLGGDG